MKITDTQQLGRMIRQTRKAQDLTQEQLSAMSGVGIRFIRELEQGKESCYIGKALCILHKLGIELTLEGHKV